MSDLHLIQALFGANLVSNICTKASKSNIFNVQLALFLVQKWCISNTHLSWVWMQIYLPLKINEI